MIEFDVDMGYLLECDELDKVVLNDENGEHEPMEFVPKNAATVGAVTCHNVGDKRDFCCSECGVRMFIESDDTYTMIASDERTIIKRPKFCPNCGARVR